MKTLPAGRRTLKKKLLELLRKNDLGAAWEEVYRAPRLQVINILFSFLPHNNEKLKWAAVEIMGVLVAELADQDMEAARTIMRRLMWNLNDESGGIGWGSPEAMAEILSRHSGLAKEYAHILFSYAMKDGNYLELEMLQRGLLWGIGRLAEARHDLAIASAPLVVPYLNSRDATVRAFAAKLAGLLKIVEARRQLEHLLKDQAQVTIREGGEFSTYKVKDLAAKALERLPALETEN